MSPLDQMLDRVAELLKLCDRADETGRRAVSTDTVRSIFRAPAPQRAVTAKDTRG